MNLFKSTALAACTTVGLLVALPAAAQFARPEAAIKYRQSVMVLQGHHLGRIFAMANGRIPFDAKVAADDAALLDTIDKLPFIAFGPGTDKGAPTRAKPEIWSEKAKFDAAAAKMVEDVEKLNAAAKTGNLDQIRAAAGAVGQSCKACHDAYQAERYSN
jgi:cytochrome c556